MNASTFLSGGGEMGELTRSYDWANHPLGVPEQWPLSLLTMVGVILRSKFPMFLWWGEDHYQFYNDAYRPSLGNPGKHPALGQKGEECWPEIWPTIYPLIQQVLNGGEATWLEDALIPIYRNNQLEDVYWTFSYSPVNGDAGDVEGVLVICNETTRLVQHLQKLQISEQRFSNLVREATIGIVVLDGEDMTITLVNEAYGRLIGRSPGELIGKKLFSIIAEAETLSKTMLEQVRVTGLPIYLYDQPYLIYANGEKLEGYLNVVYEPYREVDGTITGVMALCHDITEQVLDRRKVNETQAIAKNNAERLELALAAANLGSYELNFETGEITGNQQYRLHLGLINTDKIYLDQVLKVIDAGDLKHKEHSMQRAIETRTTYNAEYRVHRPNGTARWIRAAGNPVYNEQGQAIKMVGVTIDITEQKLFTEELAKQVHERTMELQRSNDDLLQFAHVTSHDLQEPVRKIKIWSDRLQTESTNGLSENGKFYLSRLQHATNRIQLMIQSILEFSSASSSNQIIEIVDLNDILHEVETDLEILIQEKNAVIEKGNLPSIEGASILLYQLFYNLINNSLKFSRKDVTPVITITSQSELPDKNGEILIILTDNGIGFSDTFKTNIFSAFTRLNSKDMYEGTGLGLALCQKIVERHGGTITASGVENEGAVFEIRLPLRQHHKTIQNLLSRIEHR